MVKDDLARVVAGQCGTTIKQVREILDATLETIVASKEDVKLSGFGTFQVVKRAATERRNPATGEKVSCPAKNAVKFKVAAAYKKAINE